VSPGLEFGPAGHAGHEHAGGFEEIGPDQAITALGDPAGPIDLARGISSRRQSEVGTDASGAPEATGLANRGAKSQGIDPEPPRPPDSRANPRACRSAPSEPHTYHCNCRPIAQSAPQH
jgi:hypothetical protein